VLHPDQLSPVTRAMILADLAARGVAPDACVVGPHAVSNPRTAAPQFASANTARTWKTDPPRGVPNHVFKFTRTGALVPDFSRPPNYPSGQDGSSQSGRDILRGAAWPTRHAPSIHMHRFKYDTNGRFIPESNLPPNFPASPTVSSETDAASIHNETARDDTASTPRPESSIPIEGFDKLHQIIDNITNVSDDDLVWARLYLYFAVPMSAGLAAGPEGLGFGAIPAVKYGPAIEREIDRRNKAGTWKPSPLVPSR
jgi:hypothetical protein